MQWISHGKVSPGNFWALPDSYQNELSVNQDGPAGKTGQEQDQNSSLKDHTYTLQVSAPVGLRGRVRETADIQEQTQDNRWKTTACEHSSSCCW